MAAVMARTQENMSSSLSAMATISRAAGAPAAAAVARADGDVTDDGRAPATLPPAEAPGAVTAVADDEPDDSLASARGETPAVRSEEVSTARHLSTHL